MAAETVFHARPSVQSVDTGAMISRPRLGKVDLLLQLWRAKALMAIIALVVAVPFVMLALAMPTKYDASAGLLVSLGEEQVYRPRVGSEAAGAIPDQELLNQSELELMRSPIVAERVLSQFSLEEIYPDIAQQRALIAAETPGRDPTIKMNRMGVEAILDDFSVGAAPKSNVIRATFSHENPEHSAAILNALIDRYLEYRSEVYLSSRSTGFGDQRRRFEANLLEAEQDVKNFLLVNNIGDFEAERLAAQSIYASVTDEVFKVKSRATAVDGQLETLSRQMRQTNPLVDIFVEDTTEQTLLNLRLEREQALSRYKPDSRVILAIDKQIEQVEAYLAEQTGSVGTRRTGPNPVYQDMEQRRAGLEAEAKSLANQSAELSRQEGAATARLRKLANLLPEWQELQRRRALYEQNLSSFAAREIESQALTEFARQDTDNIRVVERARVPLQGSSLKLPVLALGILFALFTALVAGLLRATTRQGFSTASSVERTTGIPVIASVRMR